MDNSNLDFRFSSFDTSELADVMTQQVISSSLLTPITCLVGIPSNIKQWPENRSFISATRVAAETYLIQLSHFNEVLVIEVGDRHHIPRSLGWLEPQLYGGINVPSWHKLVNKPDRMSLKELLVAALDDLMVTYSHHDANSENFYLHFDGVGSTLQEARLLETHSDFVHKLDIEAQKRLGDAKHIFTDAKRKDYLGISADDWDDEIGYLPRFAALTNHRGYPMVLFQADVPLFGSAEKLRIWNGKQFTTAGDLARTLCSPEIVNRTEFQLISSHLVEKLWPSALSSEHR
jgi:hypothetical protein